jgi:hypothetical protein
MSGQAVEETLIERCGLGSGQYRRDNGDHEKCDEKQEENGTAGNDQDRAQQIGLEYVFVLHLVLPLS